MYGYKLNELRKEDFNNINKGIKPYSKEDAIKWIQKAKEEGPQVFQWKAKRKNEETFWVEVALKKSEIVGENRVIAVVRDIDERKKTEDKLIEAQKMDSIGNLAGGVAHDFNNMLGGIMGYASILMQEENDEDNQSILEGIINSAKRASDLTQKLLAFGRRGKNVIEAVNVNDVISDVLSLLKSSIDDAEEIEVIQKLKSDLNFIDADPSQINQMLLNLCVNAREAMPNGGVLTVETNNTYLDFDFCSRYSDRLKPGEYVSIKVTDTGYGMTEKIKNKVFEPFFTTKKEGEIKGTGLGLATVYGIVRNHQGVVEIETEVNKGSSFIIYLPKGKKEKTKSDLSIDSDKSKTENKTALLVEDEQIVRNMGRRMLEALGYDVFTAENGKIAVDVFKEKHKQIDLVILDMKMPVMNGKESFLEMKKIDSNVKVILSTGYGHNQEAQELLDLGVLKLIAKPYDINELERILQETID